MAEKKNDAQKAEEQVSGAGQAQVEQQAPGLDSKWLKGLTFKTAEEKKFKEDGKETTRMVPVERALQVGDVLDWKDNGETVVIVTADGQKYEVGKA